MTTKNFIWITRGYMPGLPALRKTTLLTSPPAASDGGAVPKTSDKVLKKWASGRRGRPGKIASRNLPMKKRKVDMAVWNRENDSMESNTTEAPKQHVCKDYQRFFGSQHTLAGHRSNYTRAEKKSIAAVVINGDEVVVEQCPRCNKIFSSRRSLGCHKRFCGAKILITREEEEDKITP
ncbi:Uncharacterized protein Fot_17343 [Forsythia ovata]|uniref:C2H2-type domain-containing protein n=1 Tax=Forsythia ovata TaxID=205694 RepID=A0ABD1VF43_9LAMI